jgi:GT2 family glycosyltransferase
MLSVCILTYNRISLLRKLLLSLRDLMQSTAIEIIVVDNHSEDDTQKVITEDFFGINYIRTAKNVGASARNLGLKEAKGKIVVTLDDDIFGLTEKSIGALLDLFGNRPRLGAVNFRVIAESTGRICNWVHHRKVEDSGHLEFQTYEITEGAVAFRREVLEECGYYPEDFFLSHEGPDLAFRILDMGYDVIYSPRVTVVHCHSDLGRKSWLNYYYDTRNQLWVAARNFPISYAVRYLARGVSSMLFYSIRDGFLFYWVRGVVDGLKGLGKAWKGRNVLRKETMQTLRVIDSFRPDLMYVLGKRVFQKKLRLLE